jgi:hypothetical protein
VACAKPGNRRRSIGHPSGARALERGRHPVQPVGEALQGLPLGGCAASLQGTEQRFLLDARVHLDPADRVLRLHREVERIRLDRVVAETALEVGEQAQDAAAAGCGRAWS